MRRAQIFLRDDQKHAIDQLARREKMPFAVIVRCLLNPGLRAWRREADQAIDL